MFENLLEKITFNIQFLKKLFYCSFNMLVNNHKKDFIQLNSISYEMLYLFLHIYIYSEHLYLFSVLLLFIYLFEKILSFKCMIILSINYRLIIIDSCM